MNLSLLFFTLNREDFSFVIHLDRQPRTNPGFENHWIAVELVGVVTKRAALSARIRVQVSQDGKSRSIYKHVNSGGSFGANSVRRQLVGLGKAERVELLEIFWPTTGRTQSLTEVALDTRVLVKESP